MPSEENRWRDIVDALDSNLINAYGTVSILSAGLRALLQIAQADGGVALIQTAEGDAGTIGTHAGLAKAAAQELSVLLQESPTAGRSQCEVSGLRPWRERHGYEGLLLLPVQPTESVAGCLALLGRASLQLTEAQRHWLDRAVRKVGLALERSRLMEALQARVLELNLLMRVGQEIVSRPDEQLLNRTVSLVASTFGYEQVAFLCPQDGGWKVEALAGSMSLGWQVGDVIAVPDGLLPETAEMEAWEAAWASEARGASGFAGAEVAVPVRLGDEVMGILDIRSQRSGAFGQRDCVVLRSVADQIAVALENRRLLLEIQRRALYLEEVADISRRSVSIRRTRDLLREAVEMTAQQLDYEAVHIFLLDEAQKTASLVAAHRLGESRYYDEPAFRIRVREEGLVGRAARTGKVVLSNDVRQEADFVPDPEFPIMSELAIPLQTGGRVVGVLDIGSAQEDAFSQEDVNILTTLGNVLAVAIENTRLHEQERQTAAELAERNLKLVQAQARLVRAERLAAIGEISLAIKHEINNPMTAILGNAEWLLEEEQGLSEEEVRALTLIYRMALRVRDIVTRLENVEDRKRSYLQSLEMIDLRDEKDA